MANATEKAPPMFVVPAGTRASHCSGAARGGTCSAVIYWATNPTTGRVLPVDCDVPGGKRPSESKDTGQLDMLASGEAAVYAGAGVSHFLTCVDADLFSRGGSR